MDRIHPISRNLQSYVYILTHTHAFQYGSILLHCNAIDFGCRSKIFSVSIAQLNIPVE